MTWPHNWLGPWRIVDGRWRRERADVAGTILPPTATGCTVWGPPWRGPNIVVEVSAWIPPRVDGLRRADAPESPDIWITDFGATVDADAAINTKAFRAAMQAARGNAG